MDVNKKVFLKKAKTGPLRENDQIGFSHGNVEWFENI